MGVILNEIEHTDLFTRLNYKHIVSRTYNSMMARTNQPATTQKNSNPELTNEQKTTTMMFSILYFAYCNNRYTLARTLRMHVSLYCIRKKAIFQFTIQDQNEREKKTLKN